MARVLLWLACRKTEWAPPPRSLAVDAHDRIMGFGSHKDPPHIRLWREDRAAILAGSPQIVVLPREGTLYDQTSDHKEVVRRRTSIEEPKQSNRCSEGNGGHPIIARHALSPSTPRAYRRDPSGDGG